MRINMPVTNVEHELRDGAFIVSKTDLKGVITYVNREFVEISGYSEAELLGKPHNLIRHPDVPAAAFEDLWRTLKEGKPWSGLVKNRCKNGDFYWVYANAAPIRENGRVVGYMSVRSKPSRAQIEMAEALYRDMREGRCKLLIDEGDLVKPGSLSALARAAKNLNIRSRLAILVSVLSLLLLALGGYALYGMSETGKAMSGSIRSSARLIDAVDSARQAQVDFKTQVQEWKNILLRGSDPEAFAKHYKAFNEEGEQVQKNLAGLKLALSGLGLSPVSAESARKAHAELMDRYRQALQSFDGGRHESAALVDKMVKGIDRVPTEQIDGIVEMIQKHAGASMAGTEQAASARLEEESAVFMALIALALAFAGIWSYLIIRAVSGRLALAEHHSNEIAQGNFSLQIAIGARDEIGRVMQSLKSMMIRMGFEVNESRRIADEVSRIKIALDNVSTSVMIADNERNIIYMNRAIDRMFEVAEKDIQRDLPGFDRTRLNGANIDAFHKQPERQRQLLAGFTSAHRAEIAIGGRIFSLAANPVINDGGQRLGSVVEWRDRTAEVAIEKEVAGVVDAAAHGDFSRRLELDDKEGFFRQLSEGINRLMQVSDEGLKEVARVLGALAQGDLRERISADYAGTFGRLKDDTNTTVENLGEIVLRIKSATDAINTAAKEIAAGNSDLSSRTEQQASSLEETASSMEELTATVKQNADNARQASELAAGASTVAVRGGEVVGEVVHTMNAINESSRKIVDIIGVIDGIAFQTNILALNAAVEAARAGEQGRGFAVVASEVRNLAQRSAGAAKEIKALISDSVGKVESGSQLVDQAGRTMEEIVSAVRSVTEIMAGISSASQEQSSGIEQVNKAIAQMDEVTQQNAALVEEAAAAAESLEEQADNLSQSVALFRLAGGEAQPLPTEQTRLLPAAATRRQPVHSAAPARRLEAKKPEPSRSNEHDEWEEF